MQLEHECKADAAVIFIHASDLEKWVRSNRKKGFVVRFYNDPNDTRLMR